MRKSEISRKTRETEIVLSLDLDGGESCGISTGCGFFDHMLTLFACHSGFGLSVDCRGHRGRLSPHSRGCRDSAGRGLCRIYRREGRDMPVRQHCLPMDEGALLAAVDISGRGLLVLDLPGLAARVGDFDTELVEEFFAAFARHAGVTLHIRALCGSNTHHIIEGTFKAFARALRQAAAIDPAAGSVVPSSKGVL